MYRTVNLGVMIGMVCFIGDNQLARGDHPSQWQIVDSADRLDTATNRFADYTMSLPLDRHESEAVRNLAEATATLWHKAREGEDWNRLRDDYDRVEERAYKMRRRIFNNGGLHHDVHLMRSWHLVRFELDTLACLMAEKDNQSPATLPRFTSTAGDPAPYLRTDPEALLPQPRRRQGGRPDDYPGQRYEWQRYDLRSWGGDQ